MRGSSIFKKIISCLVAAFTTIALLLVLGNSGTLTWFPPLLVFSLVGLCFVAALIYPFIWQYQERKQRINSYKIYSFLNTLIRYTIAFNLASFGWKKILGLQFIVPPSIADKPMNQQSGEWLTWFYFGYSHTFGLVLALIQIVGSYFLLFRKTLLIAAITLFAFMLNLTLINFFYQLNAGALTQSVLLTMGLVYLILLDYQRLKNFFLKSLPNIPALTIKNSTTKNLIRLSAVVLSLLFTLYLK
ncbi:MAG: hypothetical protein ABJA35_07085, partial [Parafilimonas sp.]